MKLKTSSARRAVCTALSLFMIAQPLMAAEAQYVYKVPYDINMAPVASGDGRLLADPSSWNFGTLAEGSSAVKSISVSNVGTTPVTLTTVNVDAPFSQSNNCPSVLASMAGCTVQVRYDAQSPGASSGALHMGTQEGGSLDVALGGTTAAAVAGFALSASSLRFTATPVGTAGTSQEVSLTNTGNIPTSISGIGVTAGLSDFNQSNDCGAVLSPGASCRVFVSFVPSQFGVRVGNLSVYDSATGQLHSVALEGTGVAPVLQVNSQVTVPPVVVGQTGTASLTLTNSGNAPLQGLTAQLVGGRDLTYDSGSCASTLSAGTSCTLNVAFAPETAGSVTASLQLRASNTEGQDVQVNASGAAQAPKLTAEPSTVSFDDTDVGPVGQQRTVVVTNTGNTPVTVAGLSIVTGAPDFKQTNNCGGLLAVGDSCSAQVTFKPSQFGPFNGTMVAAYGNDTLTVALSGKGVQGSLKVSPSDLDFGEVQFGQTTAAKTLTLSNDGNATLELGTFSTTAGDFAVDRTSCPNSLAPQSTCEVKVTLTPTTVGPVSGSLAVSTPANTVSASFHGTGTQGVAKFSPATLTFAATQVGGTATPQTVTLSNTGTAPLAVSNITLTSGTHFSQQSTCAQVAAGASCDIQVTFAPTASGTLTSTLHVTHNGTGAVDVNLTGTAQAPSASLSTPSFAATEVGGTTTATAVLSNTGISAITVSPVTAASVAGADFSFVSSTCGSSLAQGANCSVTLKFAANNAGLASGSLTIGTSAGSQVSALSAQALRGTATLTPGNLSFSTTQVAATSSKTLTVSNTGTAPLVVSSINVSSGAEHFAATHNCTTVSVGGSCVVTVQFTPTFSGNLTGTLTFVHNGGGATTAALSGTAQAPSATLSTPVFSPTKVGASSTASATLTNTGIAPITVTVPSAISVPALSDYSFVSTTCGTSLATGQTCTVIVKFTPTSTAPANSTLTVFTQAGNHSAPLATSGIQGVVSVNPGALVFTAQQTSTTSGVQTLTVTNTGTAELQFSGVGVAAGATDFAQSNNCGTVPVSGTCTINVAFTPSASGARTGTLGLTHDGGGIATVSLSGTGQAASATLSTPSFAQTQAGSSSTAVATLTNTGVGPLTLTVPSASNVQGARFSFVSTTCTASLAAGQTCTTTVRFSPTAAETAAGTFSLVTAEAGTKSVNLAGTGLQGNVASSPASLTFATQQLTTTSGTQSFTLTNNGTSAVTFSGVGMVSGASEFGQSNNCATLAVNASCTLSVSFTPSQAGTRNGQVGLVHNGTGVTVLNVTGTGQSPSASLTTPSFAATQVGSNSTANATLTNTGVGPLTVTIPATVSGTDFSYVSTTCTASLAANATCAVTVRFTPSSTTARSGSLSVDTSAGTQTVTLGSTGIQGYASVSPSSLTFAAQQTSTSSAVQTVTVTNTGTSPLNISGVGISAGATDFAQSNNCASVAVNGSCLVNVSFTPSTTGTRTGTLSLTHNGGGVANVSLTGTGQSPNATLSTPSFAATVINSTSTATSTLTNTGVGSITLTVPDATSVTGTGYSFVSTTCTTSLTAGANCTVTLRFTPTTTASASGQLAVSTSAGLKTTNWSASATPVDYSANLSGYSNPQVATGTNSGWSTAMGQWYSVNAGGSVSIPATTYGVGKLVTVSGSTPVIAKLRLMLDDAGGNYKVNGATVPVATTPAYNSVGYTGIFTLYPGNNSITLDVTNGLGAGGWVIQVVSPDNATVISDSSGWKYNGSYVPVMLVAVDGTNLQYADNNVASSCKNYRQPSSAYQTATTSGYYLVNMGSGNEQVYCDMTTDGGGWTLIARAGAGSASGAFGWYRGVGSVSGGGVYSMNVMSRNLDFSQTLFGNGTGGNGWGAYIYRANWSRSLVAAYGSVAASIGSPYPVSGGATGGFGMAACMGETSVSVSSYFFRDMCDAPDSYGLWPSGWSTAYGNRNQDVAGQPVGASYGGYLNGDPNGLIMVR